MGTIQLAPGDGWTGLSRSSKLAMCLGGGRIALDSEGIRGSVHATSCYKCQNKRENIC